MTSRFHPAMLAAWALASSACGGSEAPVTPPPSDAAAGAPDGAIGPDSPGVDLAHRYNVLAKQSYDARCKLCRCGGFSPASPQAEACTGAVIDQYPDARAQMNCRIDVEELYVDCLSRAADCPAADACTATRTTEEKNCPPFDSTVAMTTPPAACRGLP